MSLDDEQKAAMDELKAYNREQGWLDKPPPLEAMSLNELSAAWVAADATVKQAIADKGRLEAQMRRLMDAEGLARLPTPCAELAIKQEYRWKPDARKLLQPALEYLLPKDREKLITVEEVVKVNGVVVNKLLRMQGSPALIVESAREPAGQKLEIKRTDTASEAAA